jgi:tetratricopeptide (TPR) repeat protein
VVTNSRSYSFAPYRIDVVLHLEKLETEITISKKRTFGTKQIKKVTLYALVGLPVADVSAGKLFVDTANSGHKDAASLICYQLSTGEELWRVTGVQPGGRIKFDTEQQWVIAGKPYGTSDDYIVRVGYGGNVLERNPRSGYEIVDWARGQFDAGDIEKAQALFQQAIETKISSNTKASVYRNLGEIAEQMEDTEAAVQYYTKALELNPKVGVKKQLNTLKQA